MRKHQKNYSRKSTLSLAQEKIKRTIQETLAPFPSPCYHSNILNMHSLPNKNSHTPMHQTLLKLANTTMHLFLLLPLLLLSAGGGGGGSGIPIPPPPAATENATLEYVDPTLPPLLPGQTPKCSLTVLRHDFANTAGLPPLSVNYTPPPGCAAPWSRVVLELSGSASDVQRDRIAAIWVDGAEILRTSTPYALNPGVFWQVRKDVTRYSAILRGSSTEDTTFSMMLENSNDTFPGIYTVNVTLHFYRGALCGDQYQQDQQPNLKKLLAAAAEEKSNCNHHHHQLTGHPTIKGLYREPADMIIPISNELGDCGQGYWFKVHNETDVHLTAVQIPKNTYRAVFEIYVSYHADDEYWYANPLQSTTGVSTSALSSARANGGFRQVVVSIDKKYAGAVVPFPVIYPGSINPFLWAPVAAIGAYDLPSYDIDITPFLGNLVNGQEHDFGLTVRESQPYWLVSGNLHLWLDPWSDVVEAQMVRYKAPPLRISKQADWRDKTGKSSIDGQVIQRFTGWVSSSKGNITTAIKQRLKFKSQVEVQARGSIKQVQMEMKQRTNVRIEKNRVVVGRVAVSMEAPLYLETVRSNGGGGSEFERTRVAHGLEQMASVAADKEVPVYSTVADQQESEGSVLVEGGVAVWGTGDTKSTYKYRDKKACYLRTLVMVGGKLKDDVQTASCVSLVDS